MDTPATFFAPPERDLLTTIRDQARRIESSELFHAILDALPDIAFVLNTKRQIIFANDAAKSLLGIGGDEFLGQRTGELVSCIHARETAGGCGTSEACRYCGVINTVLDAQRTGGRVSQECRLTVERDGKLQPMDLLVTGKSIRSEGKEYTLVTLNDISDANRRKVLERIFFHDVVNSITSVQAGATLLKEEYGSMAGEYLEAMLASTEHLLEEVLKQRDFLAMERGDLDVEPETLSNSRILREVAAQSSVGRFEQGKILRIEEEAMREASLSADPVLLRRVLLNMVKNALEASSEGEAVTAWTAPEGTRVRFTVRNPAVMSEEVRLQVFQRSFSTKGKGHGIGTYSMRMLARDYMNGNVGFRSIPGEGTTFWVDMPGAEGNPAGA